VDVGERMGCNGCYQATRDEVFLCLDQSDRIVAKQDGAKTLINRMAAQKQKVDQGEG